MERAREREQEREREWQRIAQENESFTMSTHRTSPLSGTNWATRQKEARPTANGGATNSYFGDKTTKHTKSKEDAHKPDLKQKELQLKQLLDKARQERESTSGRRSSNQGKAEVIILDDDDDVVSVTDKQHRPGKGLSSASNFASPSSLPTPSLSSSVPKLTAVLSSPSTTPTLHRTPSKSKYFQQLE